MNTKIKQFVVSLFDSEVTENKFALRDGLNKIALMLVTLTFASFITAYIWTRTQIGTVIEDPIMNKIGVLIINTPLWAGLYNFFKSFINNSKTK